MRGIVDILDDYGPLPSWLAGMGRMTESELGKFDVDFCGLAEPGSLFLVWEFFGLLLTV